MKDDSVHLSPCVYALTLDRLPGAPGKYEWSGGAFLFSPSDSMAVHGIETLDLKNLDNVDVFEPATGTLNFLPDYFLSYNIIDILHLAVSE